MSLPKWITKVPFTGDKSKGYWYIDNVDYVEDDGANCNVYIIAFKEDGSPASGYLAIQRFPSWEHYDEEVPLRLVMNNAGNASASFNMDGNGSSFDPGRGEVGPQCLAMWGASERLDGIGLPLRRHVTLTVVYKWVTGEVVAPPGTGGLDEAQVRLIVRDELKKIFSAL